MNVFFRRVLPTALALLVLLLFLLRLAGTLRHLGVRKATQIQRNSQAVISSSSTPAQDWGDRFGDGTPDFLRLTDPSDQAAFRRWFTMIAEYQAIRPRNEIPAEIVDCASLLRFSYREALKRHNEAWFLTTGMEISAPPGEIRAWHYPETPLACALFRVKPGAFEAGDLTNGAFAQFADARTLVERECLLCQPRCAYRPSRATYYFFASSDNRRPGIL